MRDNRETSVRHGSTTTDAPEREPRSSGGTSVPPRRGLSLGWRLGLSTALVVTLLPGILTWRQHVKDNRDDWRDRRLLLVESLAPLAADVDQAASLDEIHARLQRFQESHVYSGHPDYHVALLDRRGRVLSGADVPPPAFVLEATLDVHSPWLPGGQGVLRVRQDASGFAEEIRRRWFLWGLDMAVTGFCVLVSLQITYYLLIARPLAHLLAGLRRMENGYWGAVDVPRGAWEFRWLAYRFQRLGQQLEHTMLRLLEAERRALREDGPRPERLPRPEPARASVAESESLAEPTSPTADEGGKRLLLEYLTDQCGVLETQNPEDPQVRALAREAWGRGAVEAERLGNTRLRNRLEDAALRVLDAAAFERVSRGVAALTESHTDWLDSRESEIRAALREAGVPWVELQRRTKHVAGIWRKMQSKDLALEQVQDIFGFRVLVGDETDCYRTLEALHRRYRPHLLRFKDYIATPKANGYQSLHTSVRAEDGVELEIQVRTVEMHARAGNGVAAHWVYKSQSGVSAASISPWQRLRQRLLPGR